MTQEEKALAYDEAIKKAKEIKEKIVYSHLSTESCKAVSEYIDTIIPELRESEDERMRKMLIDRVRSAEELTDELREWILTYIEKHKEQKPLIKKGVKYYCIKAQKRCTDFYTYAFTVGTEYIAPENNVLVDNDGHSWDLTRQTPEWIFERFTPKEQKPAEWSEEDEQRIAEIEFAVMQMNTKGVDTKDKCLAWLKSLRPSWKPSEEQMEAFRSYIKDFQEKAEAAVGGWNNFDVMIRLFEQLKKL